MEFLDLFSAGITYTALSHDPFSRLLLGNGSFAVKIHRMKNISWVSNSSLTKIEYDNGNYKVIEVGTDFYLDKMKTVFPANV